MAPLFLQGPRNSCAVVLPAWGCGMGGVLGPWLAVKRCLLGLWAQKGLVRSHLRQIHPVIAIPFYPVAQGLGHCPVHVPQRNDNSGASAWETQGLLSLISANLIFWPRRASAQLSCIFKPLCNTTDFKKVSWALQCLEQHCKPEQTLSATLKHKVVCFF